MKRHILKTDPEVFQASWDEEKPYEIRLDDRNYQVGDELLLVETTNSGEAMKKGALLEYTGRAVLQNVIHKLKDRYGLLPGWCILGISYIMCFDDYSPDDKDWNLESWR
jgi:hypothetical protein